MNWPHFILWTTGIYLLYYFAMLMLDLAKHKTTTDILHELTFTEDIAPKTITHLPDKPVAKPLSPVVASGGVSLKNLFDLCKEEAIVFTRPVSF